MAAGGVVAFELIIDLGRGLQLLLQTVGAHQRRGPVHAVEAQDLLGDGVLPGGVVQLLLDQLVAEHAGELGGSHGLMGARVQERRRLFLHVGPDVVPILGHLRFAEVDLVGDFHAFFLLGFCVPFFSSVKRKKEPKKEKLTGGKWGRVRKIYSSLKFFWAAFLSRKAAPAFNKSIKKASPCWTRPVLP